MASRRPMLHSGCDTLGRKPLPLRIKAAVLKEADDALAEVERDIVVDQIASEQA